MDVGTLEERWNRQDLIEVFEMYKGFTKMDISELFTFTRLCRFSTDRYETFHTY